MARKMLLLKLASGFTAPADPKEQKELAQVLASLDGDYGKGRVVSQQRRCEMPGRDGGRQLMATSRDIEELKRAWLVGMRWARRCGSATARMVELGNKGSRELGFADAGHCGVRITTCRRMNYDATDRLWEATEAV